MDDNFNPLMMKLMYLPLIGVLLGFILCATGMGGFDGPGTSFYLGVVLFVLSQIALVAMCFVVGSRHNNATQIAIDGMKQTVEVTLNEQWQKENNVRWTVTTEQTMHTRNNSNNNGTRIKVKTWYNIQVTSLTVQAPVQQVVVQQIPMQQVMVQGQMQQGQMQQVPVQQVVMMPVQQQGAVQYVAAGAQPPPQYEQAPPQYEAGGTEQGDTGGTDIVYN